MVNTDNAWLQFIRGARARCPWIEFTKIVDIDELKLRLELTKEGKEEKSADYIFKLKDLRARYAVELA